MCGLSGHCSCKVHEMSLDFFHFFTVTLEPFQDKFQSTFQDVCIFLDCLQCVRKTVQDERSATASLGMFCRTFADFLDSKLHCEQNLGKCLGELLQKQNPAFKIILAHLQLLQIMF